MEKTEGFIATKNGKVWYRKSGRGNGHPLIIVHGGPGCSYDYLESMEDLGRHREVIFYEQIGCGKSDKFPSNAKYVPETFIHELGEVVGFFDFDKFHLLGQSWGAAVTTSYALNSPENLESLVLADPYISSPRWMEDAKRLIAKMPQKKRAALLHGAPESEEYKTASREYYARYVIRPSTLPKNANLGALNNFMYEKMWGPKEFLVTGSLKNFDLVPVLKHIKVPVLLTCGRYDEATPEAIEHYKSLIPNAKTEVFENSAHFPFWNERLRFMQVIENFLKQIESTPAL
jgi:proline iminopeptidase